MRRAARTCSRGRYLLPSGAQSHFSVGEFVCGCGCGADQVDEKLIQGLELIRAALNSRIKIVSGVRCAAHNATVGGAPESQHVPDESGIAGAADIRALDYGITSGEVFLEAQAFKYTHMHGRGLGPTTVHVDTGKIRSWGYAKHSDDKPEKWIAQLVAKDFTE